MADEEEAKSWRLERQRISDVWNRNYGMDSMDFFYGKCLDCLKYVTDLDWDSEWHKGAFETFRSECVRLSSELEKAKLTEVELNVWKETLFDANNKLSRATEPYARNAVKGTSKDYSRVENISRKIELCMKVIKEMLRILNPEEEKYKVWYGRGKEREKFLKDIGFLKGILQPTGEIQILLGEMKKLYA
jgi:hypothetical protein